MMKGLICWIIVLVAIINHANARFVKTIEKRQICSNGNCNNVCDGRTCNTCNNNACCSSVNCNSCVNQCSNNCNTASCKNNCVSGCTTACKGSNCEASSCSDCVNKCNNQCSTGSCVSDCSRNCDCTVKEHRDNDSIVLVPSGEGSKVVVNNTNNNLVNLTTHININNIVHNFNNISIPVYVNTTNINNIHLSETSSSSGNGSYIREPVPYPVPFPVPIPQPQPQPDNCCTVLHPRQCYTDDQGSSRCTIRRSRECSSACTSPVVSIEEGNSSSRSGCERVNSWPYQYCGNYVRRDCNQCYTCGGSYNPSECFRQSGCSDTCRRAAPNCVPSQNGLQCY